MTAAVAGFVAGEPVPRELVDDRVAALRNGPHAAALPAAGSAEDRQLARWVAQVILTEQLCLREADRRGLAVGDDAVERLDQRAAVEFGSITAAAYGTSPAVRAVFQAVTATVEPDEAEVRRLYAYRAPGLSRPPRWRLRHAVYATDDAARAADASALPLLGEVTAAELPVVLADALAGAGPGEQAGPVRDGLGWHVAYVEDSLAACAPEYHDVAPALRTEVRAAARRREFTRWLDRARSERLTLVPGFEHPGDPRQPDNHHRH